MSPLNMWSPLWFFFFTLLWTPKSITNTLCLVTKLSLGITLLFKQIFLYDF